mmetsp:Transcript_96997/g.301935  ORF Transcript_96997/g.301935 Transcript_96997/m.301935 type:complete len:445 (+) Transcript_96997:330-1664(+)
MAGVFHGSPVAVKAAKNTGGVSVERVVAIANEVRIMRHAHHPNIVLCYGSCVEPDRVEVLLVLERVRGPHLSTYVFEHSADDEVHVRLQLLLDVACALRYLHAQSPVIVHGDLKGSNVLVEASVPRAKLVDFGLSRLLTKDAQPLGGSLGWMAPELILKHATSPKPSADVFSFGRLVYLVLACRTPLEGMCAEAIKEAARAGHTPSLVWDVGGPLSMEGTALCEGALRFAPEGRPDMRRVHREASSWELPGLAERMPALELARAERGEEPHAGLAGAVRSLRAALPCGAAVGAGVPGAGHPGPPAHAPAPAGQDAAQGARPQPLPPLALRAQLPTKPRAKAFMLLEILHQWNYPLPEGSCCGYHAALADLSSVGRQLKAAPCQVDFEPNDAYQCRLCGMLDESTHAECTVCGEAAGRSPTLTSIQEEEPEPPESSPGMPSRCRL